MMKASGFKEFYSRYSAGHPVELFLNARGAPSADYPHVRVAHRSRGRVDVMAVAGRGEHVWCKRLFAPSEIDVEEAIEAARLALEYAARA